MTLPDSGPVKRTLRPLPRTAAVVPESPQQRIPGYFQLLLAIYVIFTGTLPTIIQAAAFGVAGGSGTEFPAAMATGVAVDLLMLLPVILLANHPLGILHPVLIAVVVWPLLIHMPNVIQDWGGWTGILSGSRVDAPIYQGLPSRSASTIWAATAKFNMLKFTGLACTYAGFWIFKGKTNLSRLPVKLPSAAAVRTIMLCLITFSFFVLIVFVRMRGGVNEHLTSLGGGRFKELSSYGPVILLIDMGSAALFVWAAANPDEIKRPLFLAAMGGLTAATFISNGSRGGALEVPLVVGLIWALRRRKIPWKIAIALIPFMFVAIGFLGAIRTSSWTGGTAAQTVQASSWSQSFARAQQEVEARNSANASIPVAARGFEVTGGLLLGKSYASVVTSLIPRPLWPDKPRGVGSLYAQLFLGAQMSGTTIPVTPEVELYWNFGVAGVIVFSILYGAILRGTYNFFWRRYPNAFATVFYIFVITSFQFSSDRLTRLEQRMGLILLCYLAVALFAPMRRYKAGPSVPGLATPPSRVLPAQS